MINGLFITVDELLGKCSGLVRVGLAGCLLCRRTMDTVLPTYDTVYT